MKRTPLKRKTPLARGKKGLRRTRIRRMSKALQIENGHYLIEKAIYLRDNPWCKLEPFVAEAEGRPARRVKACDVHHKKGRKGPLLRDQRYWEPAARSNHDYVEAHKKWGRSVGLILYK